MKEMIYGTKRKVEVLYEGTYKDHKFAILNLGTHPTAYVENKLKGIVDYCDNQLENIDVHFGFSYMGGAYWDKDDKTEYLGWDYGHVGDYMGYSLDWDIFDFDEKKHTTKEIYDEVKSVIDQLIELENEGD